MFSFQADLFDGSTTRKRKRENEVSARRTTTTKTRLTLFDLFAVKTGWFRGTTNEKTFPSGDQRSDRFVVEKSRMKRRSVVSCQKNARDRCSNDEKTCRWISIGFQREEKDTERNRPLEANLFSSAKVFFQPENKFNGQKSNFVTTFRRRNFDPISKGKQPEKFGFSKIFDFLFPKKKLGEKAEVRVNWKVRLSTRKEWEIVHHRFTKKGSVTFRSDKTSSKKRRDERYNKVSRGNNRVTIRLPHCPRKRRENDLSMFFLLAERLFSCYFEWFQCLS